MLSPVELEIELFCRGMRIDPSCNVDEDGRRISRTRAGLGSGLELVLPGPRRPIWVNVPVVEAFAESSPLRLTRERRGYQVVDERTGQAYAVTVPEEPLWYSRATSSGIPMSRIGVLQGNYLGVYVSNACMYWASTPSRACKFCTTGRNVGVGEESRKKVDDVVEVAMAAKEESGALFTHLNTGYHFEEVDRLEPIHGLRQCEPFVRALRARVGGFIGVQAMPVPRRKFHEYDALIDAGADHFSFCYEFEDPEWFARLCPGKAATLGQEGFFEAMEYAAGRLGRGRVSGEIIAGLEPIEATMRGIDRIVAAGAFPTVCIFRPTVGSELEHAKPPDPLEMKAVFAHLYEACRDAGLPVGILPIDVSLVVQPEEAAGLLAPSLSSRFYEGKLAALRWLARPYVEWKRRPSPRRASLLRRRQLARAPRPPDEESVPVGPRRSVRPAKWQNALVTRARNQEADPVVGRPLQWAKLTALGALSALWSLFLWMELILSRSGGSSFCGSGGKLDCTAIWNGALASAVHRLTGLPVSGWGVVWSVAAFALPLTGLLRMASGGGPGPLVSAVRLTAAAGLLVVAALLAASAVAGAICIGCIGTYLLVLAYAAIALLGWRKAGLPEAGRGVALAAGCTAAAFALLLYPGLHTPKASGEAGRRAVAEAAGPTEAPQSEAPQSQAPARAGTGDAARDRALEDLVSTLDPAGKQQLADSLAIYRNSPPMMLPAPRALVGSTLAPVRITEFTDILCEHCASLYETLQTLRGHTAPGSYSVDARQFPLDGRCNPKFTPGKGDDVRCVAAAARICMESSGREPELAGALFERQQGLTRDAVFQIAAAFMPREKLAACIASPQTQGQLEQDIAAASQYDSDGTPIVAVNGRRGTSYGPFLYAMILTRGNPEHPAFDALPPGNPSAHLH